MTRLIGLYPRAWRDPLRGRVPRAARRTGRPMSSIGSTSSAARSTRVSIPRSEPTPAPIEPPVARRSVARAGRLADARSAASSGSLAMVVAINGPIVVEEWGPYRDGAAALPICSSPRSSCSGSAWSRWSLDLPASAHAARIGGLRELDDGARCGAWLRGSAWCRPDRVRRALDRRRRARGEPGAGRRSNSAILVAGIVPGWCRLRSRAGPACGCHPTANPDLQFLVLGRARGGLARRRSLARARAAPAVASPSAGRLSCAHGAAASSSGRRSSR